MTAVLLILFAWGVVDVALIGALTYGSRRAARRGTPAGERVLRVLRVGETSVRPRTTDPHPPQDR